MTNSKEIFIKIVKLTIDQFNKNLEDRLTIIREPSGRKPYYICEYISPTLCKYIVNVYIIK